MALRAVPRVTPNDPLVLVYARALLISGPEGRCGYIGAGLYAGIARTPHGTCASTTRLGVLIG
jgi:hypothetical protein